MVAGVAVVVLLAAYYAFVYQAPTVAAPGGPQGKLDIGAVCAGALVYMTFPDAQAAQAFVAECEAGEHPEVIERYKANLNLGDGAAI